MMIFACVGPTASGKTSLAIELANALHGPIVNADAFQVYRGMNIGTNKDLSLFQGIPHYLFDLVEPKDGYTVAQYQRAFRTLMTQLQPEKNPVIVVGGTGLYLKASLYDFAFETHEKAVDLSQYLSMDDAQLYAALQAIDAVSAETIHPHNRRRVLRAIEIYLATGKTKSETIATQQKRLLYPVRFIGLNPNRETVYKAINARVLTMVEAGLVDEVSQLLKTTPPEAFAFDAIGYKETIAYLQGVIKKEEWIAKIQQATRRYAKRQWTYFHHQLPVTWFSTIAEAKEACLHG
jgi:tRNA dimethylallyltransferase